MRQDGSPDRHAAERERKRRKARYGMRVVGAGVRLIARLSPGKTARRRRGA